MITLTVGLPVFRSKNIVWLAMECLCRQKAVTFEWELIICEEQDGNAAGEQYFKDYLPRLKKVGCQYIKYIPLARWIPLAQKWKIIGTNACRTSVVFVQQAADDYWHSTRLRRAYDVLITKQYDWYHTKKVFMYHIFSSKVIYYDHDTKGYAYRNIPAVGHAILTKHIRNLPLSDKKRGIDGWLFKTINRPRIYTDLSKTWKLSCGTQGMNSISLKRAKFFETVTIPFRDTKVKIETILPADIVERLHQVRDEMLATIPPEEPAPVVNNIIDIDANIPISFVYVWVKAPAVWNELIMSIRSVKKYYQGKYQIFVVGDNPELKDVIHVPAPQVKGFAYCRSMDIANKLQVIIDNPEITQNFVFMYDDIILLRPVTLEHLRRVVAIDHVDDPVAYFQPGKALIPSARWRELFSQTMYQLSKRNLPTYNYETHLPRVLNKILLSQVIAKYKLNEKPYLFNTLYFNTYHQAPEAEIRSNIRIKAGVYRPYDNPRSLEREIDGKLFLNYDDKGLNNLLKKKILDIIRP